MASLMEEHVKEMKELMELKELYGWDDDDPRFLYQKDEVYKNFKKMAGKMKKASTAQDAEDVAPTITSWEHVAELNTKDFDKAKKMMITHLPGNWMPDKWSRGGKVAYGGQPKCDWRRRMTKDGKQIVRLIQYKNIMILQNAKSRLEGAHTRVTNGMSARTDSRGKGESSFIDHT